MSKLLGVIKAIIGQVYVVDANGAQRLVHEGDRVYSGEEIVTGASGAVSISLPDGKTLDIGRNSHWGEHGLQVSHHPESSAQDIAAAQKAIADGADPTQVLEATAAGNEAPVTLEGGGGGHTLVQLELTGQVVDPTAGFNTKGLGNPNWDINLPIGGVTAGSASVFPPEVQITEFAGNDGFINKSEFHQTHLSGTSNQNHITLTFTDSQKNTFTVTVPVSNGHWNIDTDLGGLVPGNVTVVAIATDVTGRTAESFDHALIDITGPHIDITVDNVTPDNLINYEESRQPQTLIHGSVGGDTKPGDIVTLLVDGKEYTGVVTDPGNGTLTYTIPVLTQGLLHDPNIHATLTSTDDAGNTTIVSTDHHVDNDLYAQNAVTIETVANDDVVNANEFRMPTIISGIASGDAKAGDPVTLTIQGKAFHGTVFDDHGQLRYEIVVPSATLKEGANDVQVTLVSHDAVGNEATAVTHRTVVLDTQAHNALTIDDVTTDNTLNRAELYMRNQVISGTVSGEDAKAGDPVLVEINGHQYNGQIIDLGNSTLGYRIAVNAADFANNVAKVDGYMDVKVTVTSHDAAGNLAIATDTHSVHVDNFAKNTVHIDTVANDNVVNAIENRMTTLISGVAGGDAKVGDAVTVSVQGQSFTGTVVDDNGELRYEVAVPVGTLKEGKNAVVVTLVSHDAVGNEVTALAHRTVVLDTKAHNTVNIHDVTDDNTLNFTELSAAKQTITGNVRGEDAKAGDPVQVEINGHRYHGQVIDTGKNTLGYRIEVDSAAFSDNVGHVLKEATVHVSVTSHDAAGNLAIATSSHDVHLDNFAENTVHIDTVANDNVVNAIENRMTTLISGVAGGDAKAGDAVTVSVRGQNFTGTMVDDNGELRYEVAVPVGTLKEGKNAVVVTLVSHDAVGNEVTALAHRTVVLDTKAHNTVNIHDVTADNTLNFTELSAAKQTIAGNVRGEDAKAGDPVLVEINGYQYHGQVIDTGKNTLGYRIEVDSAAFSDNVGHVLKEVTVHVSVTSHDAAGNLAIATSSHDVHIDNFAENTVHIDTVAGDDLINIKEFSANGGFTQIAGTVTGVDAKMGDAVTLALKGGEVIHSVVIALAGGGLGYSIPVNSHKLVTHPEFTVSVTSTDPAGNSVTHSETKTISADLYTQSYITIDDVTADNFINIKESTDNHGKTTISGTVSGDAKEHDTVQLVINGQHYSGEVEKLANGNLVYHIPVDTQNLVNNPVIHASIHTTDEHGNEMTAVTKHHVGLDLDASASIGIDTVASDDIISKAESNLHKTIITGSVGDDAQKEDVVTLTFNGKTYSGKVFERPDHSLGYRIEVSTDNLQDGSDQKVHVSISTVDEHGNPATATHDHTVHIDLHAEATITIDPVTDDNTLNHSELNEAQQIISGTVGGDAKVHDVVRLEINGRTFTGEVITLNNGKLGYQIPVDPSAFSDNQGDQDKYVNIRATVVSYDAVGNEVTAISDHDVHIDNFAVNQVHIDTVAGDDVINIKEFSANGGITQITGTVTGADAKVGDAVTLALKGGEVIHSVVIALAGGGLGYSIPVNSHKLVTHPEFTVSVTSTDPAGNSITHSETKTISADLYTQSYITIDDVTADNFINIKESTDNHGKTTISGTVSGDAKEHDTVQLVINGQHYSGEVEKLANGNLVYHIPVDTQNLVNNPVIHASIHTTDEHGNEMTAVTKHHVGLDLDASASIGIDTVASDDIISKAESNLHKTIITGPVGGDAQKEDVVTLTFNGKTYSGKVFERPDHSLGYRIEVSTDNLQDGSDQKVHVSISTVDEHGNPATATSEHTVHIDLHAEATITIDPVTDDNTLNHSELNEAQQIITGTVGGDAKLHDVVSLEINGHTFKGEVITLNNGQLGYQIPVDSSAFSNNQGHQDKNVNIKATVVSHDAVGNEVTAISNHDVHIDNFAVNQVHIGSIAGDDVINIKEFSANGGITQIAGTVTGVDAAAGDVVTLQLDGVTVMQGVVITLAGGKLGFSFPMKTHMLMSHPEITISVTSSDAAGNSVTHSDTKTISADMYTQSHITIDGVTDDNFINIKESTDNNGKTIISGSVSGDAKVHDTVELVIDGHHYSGVVEKLANGGLGYHIPVDTQNLVNDPVIHASIHTKDNHGNETTATADRIVGLDLNASASIGIDTVASDDIISKAESGKTTFITGTVGDDAQKEDVVTLTFNGKTYSGKVFEQPDHSLGYRIEVSTDNLQDGSDQKVHVSISTVDEHGNPSTATHDHMVHIDLHAEASITIDPVTDDNVLNHFELDNDWQLISGVVGKDAQVDDDVSVEVNGNTYTGKVIVLGNGQLGYQIPVHSADFSNNQGNQDKDVTFKATVTSHDAVGNEVVVSTTHKVHIDNHARAGITIDTVAGDNMINGAESTKHTTEVMGTVSGDVHMGDKVIVTVNGHHYDATVQKLPEHNNALGYKLDVLTGDLVKDPHIVAQVVGVDDVGNQQRAEATQDMAVDLHAKALLTIDPVTGDNMVNGDESRQPFTYVTGRVGGDVHVNDIVYLTVNGHTLTGKVSDQGGHLGYSIKVSTADLLSDPHLTATVSTTDVAGNPATANAETTVVIDTRIDATITIDDVTPDNTLNYNEQHQTTTVVSGTVTGEVHKGDPLVMTINGVIYNGTVDDIGGNKLGYSIIVNTADLVANPHIEVTMDVTDAAKNHAHVVAHHDVNLDDRAFAAITIDRVTGDNVLNGTELQAPKTIISGTVGGDAHKGNIVHLVVDGHAVDATVVELPKLGTLGYSVEVDTQWLKNDPNITATITTHDAAGNSATADAKSTVTIDDHAEAIVHIDPLVTDHNDDVISYKDAHNPQTTVTGSVGGDVRVGDQVELTINNQTYYAEVKDNGNGQHVFSTQVSTLDLLMDPNIKADVTAKDAAGNVAHGHDDRPVEIDTHADAGIYIESAKAWPYVGYAPGSHPEFIRVEGYVTPDAQFGDLVTIDVGGNHLQTQVITMPNGALGYTLDILSSKWNDNGNITVSITTHDNHGNTATAVEHRFIDLPWMTPTIVPADASFGIHTVTSTTPPPLGTTTTPQKPHVHLTVDPVAGDDVLNHAEAGKPTTPVRGLLTGDVSINDTVIVTVNGHPYPGKVIQIPGLPGEFGYQVDVPTDVLKAHPTFEVSVSVHNSAGDDTAAVTKTITVDTDNPVHITMDNVAGDDVINGSEAKSGTTTISGTVSGEGIHDGSIVSLQVNGNTLTAVVHAGATEWVWSRDVSINDLRNNPDITASVSATDAAGNTGTDSTSKHVEVDLKADAGVTVDDITTDNVLNSQEVGQAKTTVSGSVSGDVKPGENVTLTVNGHDYNAVINASNHYTVDVNTADLVTDHSIKATVTGHDNHGNVQDANFTKAFSVDTTATAAVTVNTVGGDDVINAAEIQAGKVEVSGTVDGDVHKTDKVYITVNGNQVEATVIELPHMNGQLGYKAFVSTTDLQADPTIHVSVTGHDTAGNIQTATYDKIVIIDDRVDATIVLDPVSNDDVLNNVEAGQPTTIITGSVTGDVEVGDQVTVTVNGKDLPAIVSDSGGKKVFRVEVSTVDLVHDQHITAHVVAHDDAGNRQQIDTDKTIHIDRVASGSVDIDSITVDNVLNHQELSGQKVNITGHVGGDAQLYDPVTLTIGGHKYQGSVITLSGGGLGYQIDVDSAVLRSDAHKVIDVELTGHDAPGNPFTAKSTHTYSVDEQANGAITINDHIAGDNVVNLNESKSDTVIKFTVSGDTHPTDVVDVSVNGNNMKASLVPGSSTVYQVAVPGTYLNEGDNKIEVKTTLHDDAGNTLDVHDQKNVVLDTHADGAITINDGIAADNVVNLKESQSDTVIRFTVSGDTHSTDVVEVNINGHLMKATLAPGSSTVYQVAVQSAYLKEGINDIDVKTTLHDDAGNTIDVSDHKTIVLDTHADASIVVDKVTGDNHISRAESHDTVTHITGSVSGDVNDGDHTKALVNGHQYDAILHQGINGLTYDIEADTSAFRAGHNRVNVLVEAHDNHGNITPYSQTLNVTMDEPAPVKGHTVDKGNHAAMQHALHNLFDDNALSLSYAPAATGHGQATAVLSADDKAKGVLEKVDLSDLARELHEGVDIAKYIQSGGDHHLIASPAKVAHGIDTALSTPASGDLHSPTYSLDHLIAKPDQNHTH